MKKIKTDVIIIGAGPAGVTAAAYLQNNGLSTTLLEKAVFPRYIVGESLLPKSMEHFEEVGFLEPLKKQNYLIKPGARFIKKGKVFNLSFSEQHTKGWSWTWQVPRAHFDNVLADEVKKKGAEIYFDSTVKSIKIDKKKPRVKFEKDGETYRIKGKFIIDASGFACVLPRLTGQQVQKGTITNSSLYTIINEADRSNFDNGELISFEVLEQDLWYWVIPFSDGTTSIGFAGDHSHFGEGTVKDLDRLMKKLEFFDERFKNVKYNFKPVYSKLYSQKAEKLYGENFVLAGNTVEFLDPIFSSGVALATESGLMAAKTVHKKLNGENVDFGKEYVGYMVEGIEVYRQFIDDWYDGYLQDVFFADNINQDIKNMFCSILGGYVWDKTNPAIRKKKTIVKTVAHLAKSNGGFSIE